MISTQEGVHLTSIYLDEYSSCKTRGIGRTLIKTKNVVNIIDTYLMTPKF